MAIQGIHHITLVTADAQRNVDFYTRVLGQRLVKKTVNFDDPTSYHLYFGDALGRPGTAITFFEWRGVPKGFPGIGGTHHFALSVADETGLLKWKRRLTDLGIAVQGPYDRRYFRSIYFRDPDGTRLEIATPPNWVIDESADSLGHQHQTPPQNLTKGHRDEAAIAAETWPEPVLTITEDMALMNGMHHISAMSSDLERTHAFYAGLLEMNLLKMTDNFDVQNSAHWYWGDSVGRAGTILSYFGYRAGAAPRVKMGAGQTHHFALAVPDEDSQLAWREKLVRAGLRVSPVTDRVYFKSIYTQDPDGHIVELATAGPGFAADESGDSLGNHLMLPPWLEAHRDEIESTLTPITVEPWKETTE